MRRGLEGSGGTEAGAEPLAEGDSRAERDGEPLAGSDSEAGPLPDGAELLQAAELPMFAHPPWTVGVVLVIGVVMLIIGVLGHPVWLLLGAPFIAVLAVWLVVKVVEIRRGRDAPPSS